MTTCLGKCCSFGLPRVSFVNCYQFIHLVISGLVLRAGHGICLYQSMIIAYPFTMNTNQLEPKLGQVTKTGDMLCFDLISTYMCLLSESINKTTFIYVALLLKRQKDHSEINSC